MCARRGGVVSINISPAIEAPEFPTEELELTGVAGAKGDERCWFAEEEATASRSS